MVSFFAASAEEGGGDAALVSACLDSYQLGVSVCRPLLSLPLADAKTKIILWRAVYVPRRGEGKTALASFKAAEARRDKAKKAIVCFRGKERDKETTIRLLNIKKEWMMILS